ncbi:unnamed protein product [Arabis nemorensis]|uniref:Uncharacterized protein n=1 Tax=Arabis nemorensis TaxID=586526 RepID=A0A565C4Q9_9BRAS|nr:unnamed protein product [Arabis nemorensis]
MKKTVSLKIELEYDRECEIDTVFYATARNEGWWDYENYSLPIDLDFDNGDKLFGKGLRNLGCT